MHADARSTRPAAPTRRSLVRTAVVAWTAPLVTALTAAPAQAVGSGVVLAMTGTFTHAAGNRNITLTNGNVANNGTGSTANLQVTVTLTTNGTTDFTGTTVNTTPTGFTAGTISLGGSSGAYTATWVFTKTTQLAGGTNVPFAPVLRTANNTVKDTAGSGSAVATATSAPSAACGNGYLG